MIFGHIYISETFLLLKFPFFVPLEEQIKTEGLKESEDKFSKYVQL